MSIEKPPTKDIPLSTYLLRVLEQLENAINVCRTHVVTGNVKNPVKGRLYLVTTSMPQFGSQGLFYYNGTQFVKISDVTSAISLGTTHDKAYYGDFGEVAYQHSKILGNPHKTTAADIGLENVDNTSDLSKPVSNAVSTALQGYVLKTTKINNKPLDGDITLNTSNINPVSARQYVTAEEKLRLNTPADASHDGYLLSTDWVIFNGKQNALGFTPENVLNKDASNGYVGLTLLKINFKNAAATVTSFFTNSNTASRTYTYQDKDGTVALSSDTHDATSKTTPVDADELSLIDSAASYVLKKLTWSNLKATLKTYFDTLYLDTSGWMALSTCTFETADAPIFQFSIAADVTGFIGVGNRIKLTQTTVKYFIVHAVSYAAGKTTITVFGGTDYVLANAAITNPFFSIAGCPFGFPATKESWSVTLTDTALRSQASPTSGTWYNLGSLSIIAPIGAWYADFEVCFYLQSQTNSAGVNGYVTLSTSSSAESNAKLTAFSYLGSPPVAGYVLVKIDTITKKDRLDFAAKTTLYLLAKTSLSVVESLNFYGAGSMTKITLTSAYL